MSDLPRIYEAILGRTNLRSRSREVLISRLHHQLGASSEEVDQAIRELLAKKWIVAKNGLLRSNKESDYYLYPDEFYTVLNNGKAIHKIVRIANKSYYPNLKLSELLDQQIGVEKQKVVEILELAFDQGFLVGLPLDLRRSKKFSIVRFINGYRNNQMPILKRVMRILAWIFGSIGTAIIGYYTLDFLGLQ